MSFFTSLFKPTQQGTQSAPALGVGIQSSIFGKPIPLIYGLTKVAGNLIIYGNFITTTVAAPTSAGGGGGKGSLFTPNPGTTGTQYNYSATFAFALSEGPISGVVVMYKGQARFLAASLPTTVFTGSYPQTAWSYGPITWSVVDQNAIASSGTVSPLGYNGVAYIGFANLNLGTATTLPNFQYEVFGLMAGGFYGSGADADPTAVLSDFLTNSHYGLGLSSGLIGSLTTWQQYALANGLWVSPAYTTQRTAADMIDELMTATNSACFWSSGKFQVQPYGDAAITGNGFTYTPNFTPLYALTDNDFLRTPQNNVGASASAGSAGPVLMSRKRKSDTINSIKIEFLHRTNNYNPAVCYANDQSEIDSYGLRTNGSKQLHLFCDADAANLSANLQLRRQQVVNTFKFDLDQRYILLDPMDIISITDSALGVTNLLVRVVEILENDDQTLSFTCEEVKQGTGSAPKYTFGKGIGQAFVNYESAPPAMNAPFFFEPPWALNGDLEVWAALSGPAGWGGADVWVSTDGTTYTLQGTVIGNARMGTLSQSLATFTPAATGQTIDQTHTLQVDLGISGGVLTSASSSEAQKFSTLCYVDGELISYGTAALVSGNKYNLTYLVRGGYSSTISAHSSGSNFARLDAGIFKLPFTQDRVGQTISIKFLSFNQWNAGKQTLAAVSPVTYMIQGTALKVPPADVTNVAEVFIGNIAEISWSEITDFRPILYEIRQGSSWTGGQFITRQAHPPFRIQGDGLYWIGVYTQPVAGLIVYSANPVSINVVGANVTANIIATRTENPSWPGTLSGSVALVGAAIETTGTGGGSYTIPTGDRITITYPFACAVIMKWTSSSSPLNNSLFLYSSGVCSLTAGSTLITGLQVFSGNGVLHGNTLIDGISNTTSMGPGEWVVGTGIPAGAQILSIASSVSINITLSASTGSTAASTQALTVFPNISVGNVAESTSTGIIPAGAKVTAVSTDYTSVSISTTSLVTSTVDKLNVSIDFLNTADLFGAAAAVNATVQPQVRLSTDGGITFSSWQNWKSGYYLGNVFDARMQVQSLDVNSVGVLSAFSFSVDVPSRIDHYTTGFSVSSAGSTLFFRPDGGTTAAFNGGNGNTTSPLVQAAIVSGNPSRTVIFNAPSLSAVTLFCYSSTGGAISDTVHVLAAGF